MIANKVMVVITVEALSIDVVPGMVAKALEQLECEFHDGRLEADDGDTVIWTTTQTQVTF